MFFFFFFFCYNYVFFLFFFFSSRRRHTRYWRDWSSDVCSSDLAPDDTKTLTSWSALCEARGDLVRAGELLDRAEAASSAPEVALQRSNLLARSGKHE